MKTSPLARIGRATAAHPWRTITAWLFVLVAAVALSGALGGEPKDDYRLPGSPSQAGTDLLAREFPAFAGADARVVVHSSDGRVPPSALRASVPGWTPWRTSPSFHPRELGTTERPPSSTSAMTCR